MKVLLNDSPLDIVGITEDTTVKDILQVVQEQVKEKRMTILEVNVDGKAFDFEKFDELEKIKADSVNRIELLGATPETLIQAAVADGKTVFPHLVQLASSVSEKLRIGNIQEAMKMFLELIEGIDWLSKILNNIGQAFPEKMAESQREINRVNLLKRLSEQTKMLQDAQNNQDWVSMADIIEYELIEVLKISEEFFCEIRK